MRFFLCLCVIICLYVCGFGEFRSDLVSVNYKGPLEEEKKFWVFFVFWVWDMVALCFGDLGFVD